MNAAILFIIILFGLLILCLIATKLSYFEGYTNTNTLWADTCNKEKEDGCYNKPGSTGHTGSTGHSGDTPASPGDSNDRCSSRNNVNTNKSDLYMLKSACIPPICPTCPDMVYPDGADGGNTKNIQPTDNSKVPYPILPDFTSFGI
jgi:hypothetical protein